MFLTQLAGTCSMFELRNVGSSDFASLPTFRRRFAAAKRDLRYEKPKSIIYNTNMGPVAATILKKMGFKKINSYKGNVGNVLTFVKNYS